jgi:hypothetical protein
VNLRERYRPIALASNLLVISSFFVLVVLLFMNQGLSLVNVAIGSAIILIANMLFVCAGILAPSLVEPGRIVFPLNFTLPLVYSAWGAVVAYLSWRIGNPLEPTMKVFRQFADLFEVRELIWFPIVQFAGMTVAAVTNSRAAASESVDSA